MFITLRVTRSAGHHVSMSTDGSGASGWLRHRTAEEIRVLLARKRMSAAELARRTGIKQSTMARRMTGETAFDLDDLELIATALEVDVTDLLPRTVGAGVGVAREVEELKKILAPPKLPDRSDHVRVTQRSPVAPPRRDSTRPDSSVPATRRRPVSVRPPNRPIAA
jgi:transcriptional regulator with XRE-family HTH domain